MGKSVSGDKNGKSRKNPPNPKKTAGTKKPEIRTVRKKNETRGNSGIAKSKQLLSRLAGTGSNRSVQRKPRASASSAPRVCGNGMPMPSLAELERMYDDDSDDDDNNATNAAPSTVQPTDPDPPARCDTPVDQPLVLSEDKLTSPTTLKVIGSKMMDLISNLPVITIDDNLPHPPVIPPRKRKKSDTPYIVGCTERPQVPWEPKTRIGIGDTKYGVEQPVTSSSEEEENSIPKKRRKAGTATISKSIFNPKSEEIASWLKQSEQFDDEIMKLNSALKRKRSSSIDSNKTVDYSLGGGSPPNMDRFSPLPSTSRDNDTFLKNDQRFNESLHSSNVHKTETESDNEIEIVDAPVEIVEIDDTLPIRKIEPFNQTDDDCCVIVEPQSENTEMETSIINIDSPNDNGHGSLDFNLNLENSDCEIIDVEDVLAESQAIMAKYQKRDGLDSVTVVDPGRSYAPKAENTSTAASVPVPAEIRENNPITQEDTSGVRNIEEVVINFFYNQNTRSYCSTVDLTGRQVLPRDLTSSLYSLPPNNNSINQNIQPATPTVSSMSVPVSLPPPSAVNALATNTLNLLIADISNVSPNRNRNRRNRVPPAVPLVNRVQQANPQEIRYPPAITPVNRVLQANPPVTRFPPAIPPVNIVPPTSPAVVTPRPVEQCTTPKPADECPPRSLSRNLGDCPICMDNLSNSQIASTICGHIFCMDCIKAAIRSNKRCPTCRKTLKPNGGYHQLFL